MATLPVIMKDMENHPDTEQLYGQLVAEQYVNNNDHSNGRWIRHLNDRLLRQFAIAVANDQTRFLNKITVSDIRNAFDFTDDGADQEVAKQAPSSEARPLIDDAAAQSNDDSFPLLKGDELE